MEKERAPRNRTITLQEHEHSVIASKLITLTRPSTISEIENKTIRQDAGEAFSFLPDSFVDLLILDPPYNMNKTFNKTSFKEMESEEYEQWLDSWLQKIRHTLKPTASIYICGDWRSSAAIYYVAKKYFNIRNRITFEREKGRGAKSNWKNCSEDIWYCTVSDDYYFDVDSVKLKRKVIAPYKHENGEAKDWQDTEDGKFRITHPSNLWTDITIPFWSMPENTDHPTQKPEKLIAKLILASSKPGDIVLDPFLGSGTSSVVAKKLGRRYVGIELDELFATLAEKRLELAEQDIIIQGYSDGIFWERNTFQQQSNGKKEVSVSTSELFPEESAVLGFETQEN